MMKSAIDSLNSTLL